MTVPSYPSGAGAQSVPAGPAPKEVETAFRLWIANVVLGIIGAVMSFALSALGVVIALIFAALYLLFAFKMRQGRNWARITLTVLGGIGVLMGVLGLLFSTGALGVLGLLLSIVQLVLIVAAIYFMFRPAANAYFTAPSYR